jgi:O-antigen/teichoic acid export membrane protein
MSITNKSYLKNYLLTYLWQGLAILLNLASMFIVIPMITNNKVIYGVYSVCVSTAMFLSYADLGFVSAGIKYAGESYAKGDHKDELKYFGFSGFILFIFVLLIASVYLLFAYNPALLIKDINSSPYLSVAAQLLFIQAVFSFSTVLQRYISGVFQIRIEQYVYQRITIVGSVIKIVSVFYFFRQGVYDIVGYFLFVKIVELLTLFVGIWIIKAKYNLLFTDYLKAFKFDKRIFNKTKDLAFGSLFVTVMWILYYELDIIAVGKMLGASAVAVYALAFTFMKFLRSLSSIIFSPFQSRYNHFVGLNDIEGLKKLLNKVILFAMPIFTMMILSILLLNKNIVLTWAGSDYIQSGIILILLAINFMYSFIRVPGANMLVTLVRVKEMYWINIVSVVVFWGGVFLTKETLGVNAFAIFKLASGTLIMLFYLRFLLKFLNKNLISFLKQTVFKLIIPVIVQTSLLLFIVSYLPTTKGKLQLLMVIGTGGVATVLGFVTLYFTSQYYKNEFNHYALKIINRKK